MTLNRHHWALLLLMSCAFCLPAAAQQANLSTANLTFPPHTPGNVSGPASVQLTNTGSANLVVNSIAASGGFSESNDCTTLGPGQGCTIHVTSIESFVGATKGVLTINDNSASSPHIVNLTGTVLAPIVLTPAAVTFPSIMLGTTKTETVKLTNNGPSFAIGAITTSGDYTQLNSCAGELLTGQTCTIAVTFRPRAAGTRSGLLSVTSKNPGFTSPLSAYTVALSGNALGDPLPTQISLQPASLNFGVRTAADALQHSQTVKLTNASSSLSLTIHCVSVLGPINNQSPFYTIGSSTCRGLLAPGAECTIEVVQNVANSAFAPQAAAGSLTIVDSDHSSPNVVSLSASILPELQLTPASLNFGAQAVGTTSPAKIVTVSNNADVGAVPLLPLTVSDDFSVVSAGANSCASSPSLTPGASCTLGVTFTPHQAGAVNGAVSFVMYPQCNPESVLINHQACPAAQVINLTGMGR